MIIPVAIFLSLVLTVINASAAELSATDAFSMGKEFGNTEKDKGFGAINNTNASANVPGYATSSKESIYYEGGMGNISTPALSDVNGCLNTTNDPNKQQYGHCESVRMINQNKGKARAMFALDPTKDPLLTKSKNVKKNPSTYTSGSSTNGTYTACVDKTIHDPDIYEIDTCEDYTTIGDSTCTIKDNVTVTSSENCTQGTWAFTNYTTWNNDNNRFYVYSSCTDFASNNQINLQVAIGAAGACGATSASFTIEAYTNVASATVLPGNPTLVPDFYGVSGRCAIAVENITYTHNGCPNNNCETSIVFNSSRGVLTLTTLNYKPYIVTYTVTDNWDNQCTALEARAQ